MRMHMHDISILRRVRAGAAQGPCAAPGVACPWLHGLRVDSSLLALHRNDRDHSAVWRVLTGRWWGSNTPQLLLAWLGVPISPWVGYPWVGAAVGDIYPDPKKTTKPFDAAFGPHVTCGLLWLLIGSLQAVVTRSFKSK